MSRKTLIIISIIFLVLITGLFVGVFLLNRDSNNTELGGTGTPTNSSGSFFPFGLGGSNNDGDTSRSRIDLPRDESSGQTGGKPFGSREGVFSQGLSKLVSDPVSGVTAIKKLPENESILEELKFEKQFLRYIERSTGHMYEIDLDSGDKKRVTNTTIPGIQEVYWDDTGNEIVVRYLDGNDLIKSFAGSTGPDVGERLAGTFLPDNISEVTVSANGEKIFYLEDFGTSVLGTIANFDGTSKNQIFDFPFREWLIEWPSERTIMLTTKPSAFAQGFAYTLNTVSGSFNKVLGDITGLTTNASPDLKYVLYSESKDQLFSMKVLDVSSNQSTDFPVATFPEKCVWSKINETTVYCGVPDKIDKNSYPDTWYQGIISFSDNVWQIDVETGALNILAFPKEIAREEIDLIHPILSPNEDKIFFMNKKDLSLWSFDLK